MQDRVGKSTLTTEQLEALQSAFEMLLEAASPHTVVLTNEERSRTTKMRPDGDWVVNRLAELATHHSLSLPGISVTGMQNDLALSQQLAPLAIQAEELKARLSDTILEARSECWWAALAYYSALVRMADTDPQLAKSLSPLIDYFATGKRKKAQPE